MTVRSAISSSSNSSGGAGGLGNPRGSVCTGYSSYVELLEPDVKVRGAGRARLTAQRVCIRCCKDDRDCRLDLDTSGCPAVIPDGA